MTSDIVFRHGDLGHVVEARVTIKLFPTSIYRVSTIWYYKNVDADKSDIPLYIFGVAGKVDERVFIDFIKISTNDKHFNEMDSKQVNATIEMMYMLNYKHKKYIWDKLTPDKYTYALVRIVKKYDSKKAAELTNTIDWNIRAKREFFEELSKEELVDVALEMARSKKRRLF